MKVIQKVVEIHTSFLDWKRVTIIIIIISINIITINIINIITHTRPKGSRTPLQKYY